MIEWKCSKRFLTLCICIIQFLFMGCLGSDEGEEWVQQDLKQCSSSIDWNLLLEAPMEWSSNLEPILTMAVALDSVMEGDTIPTWMIEERSFNQDDNLAHDGNYYIVTEPLFNCKPSLDTCYWMPGVEQYSRRVFHQDTIAWPTTKIVGAGEWLPIQMCQLDTHGGSSYFVEKGVAYKATEFHFHPKAVLVDTVSDPAKRSLYQRWWPLPRIPWAENGSSEPQSGTTVFHRHAEVAPYFSPLPPCMNFPSAMPTRTGVTRKPTAARIAELSSK